MTLEEVHDFIQYFMDYLEKKGYSEAVIKDVVRTMDILFQLTVRRKLDYCHWEFVGVYTDEGISATNTKKRNSFKQMIADVLAGKIDLIMTKSVSRFARNTVNSLTTVRKLKEKGIEVYFEKEMDLCQYFGQKS